MRLCNRYTLRLPVAAAIGLALAGAALIGDTNPAWAGFNGDGKLDAIFANVLDQTNRVCLGDGGGGFTCSDVSANTTDSNNVAVGDVNGEGIVNQDVHLLCYEIERPKGKPKSDRLHVSMDNQFGDDQVLEVRKPKLVCVPSTKGSR